LSIFRGYFLEWEAEKLTFYKQPKTVIFSRKKTNPSLRKAAGDFILLAFENKFRMSAGFISYEGGRNICYG